MKRGIKHILTFPPLLSILLILLCVSSLDARTRTTRKNLKTNEVPVAVLESADDFLPDSLLTVDPTAVTLKGFAKRASDTKESFFITNNVQRLFYYYAGPQPRKQATPFKVAFRLTGYDIPVGN